MAKWRKLTVADDILAKGMGELIGIEELWDPDNSLVIHGNINPKNTCRKRTTTIKRKSGAKKMKQQLEKQKFNRVTFSGFSHHSEMMSWNEFQLKDEILAALYDKKFFEPTEIQLKCLGPAVCGLRDILGAAETGSGKTLAFGIPIVNGILKYQEQVAADDTESSEESDISEENWKNEANDVGCVKVENLKISRTLSKKNRLLALILTPTRELASQVRDHIIEICKYTSIKIVLVVGGLAHEKQERLLKKHPEIIVATPGRLWDLIQSRVLNIQDIKKIRYLAIDETDRMLEKGHFEELNKLLECMNMDCTKSRRQNFVFSATLTLVHDPPSYLKGEKCKRLTPGIKLKELMSRIGIKNHKIIDITNSQITPQTLKEFKVICKFEEKDYYLHYFLKENKGKSIIFCNSIGCVKRLANLLNILEYSPLPLHSNMIQKQRLKNLEKFREKINSILIATDVAARGLDITDVVHVIHYQVPKTSESYVHRSGRTARKKTTGNVLLLIEPQEYKTYIKILNVLGRSHEIENLDVEGEIMQRMKQVIHLARDIDQLMLAIKKQNTSSNWLSKAVNEMDIIMDEDELPKHISDKGIKRMKDDLNRKRKSLKALIQQPHIPKHMKGKFPSVQVSKSLSLTRTFSSKDHTIGR